MFKTQTFKDFISKYTSYKKVNVSNNSNNQINNDMNYINEINNLKYQLNEEKKKNDKLYNENTNLKNIITKLNNEINRLKQYEHKNKLLQEEINKQNIEIQKYKSDNNKNFDEGITSVKPGEKIISINFVSMGSQDIGHYSLICKNTELFVRLEERLYDDFPQFKNYETYFEKNTKRIKRFKTLDENEIKNKDVITIFTVDI